MSQLSSLSCKCRLTSSLCTRFPICNKLDESLRSDIKLIHIFSNNCNVLFVTTDDRVFGFGRNMYGVLGLGHNESVEQPIEVTELKDKKAKEFFVGEDFVVAISDDNRVFTWGHNNWGQLGRGCFKVKGVYHKPSAINLSLSEDIIQVCCERRHTLVLTSSGRVYGWGRNKFGEIGMSSQEANQVSVPKELKLLQGFSIKSIRIGIYCNFGVTSGGRLLTWARSIGQSPGKSKFGVEDWEPVVIMNIAGLTDIDISVLTGVVDVCDTPETSYVLTNDGDINKFSSNDGHQAIVRPITRNEDSLDTEDTLEIVNSIMMVLDQEIERFSEDYANKRVKVEGQDEHEHGVKFKAMMTMNNVVVGLGTKDGIDEDRVYYLNKVEDKVIKTDHKTFFDFFYFEKDWLIKTTMIHSITKKSSCLFNDENTSDFKIKIRAIDGNYDLIYCHKSVLTQRSEYFERMFAINWSESNDNEMEVIGHSLEAFYHYIRWLYTDCIATQDIELLIQMLSISDQYLDNDFRDKCLEHLNSQTNVQNVCSLYSQSIRLNFKEFQEICFAKIVQNFDKVLETESFKSLNADVSKHLIRECVHKKLIKPNLE